MEQAPVTSPPVAVEIARTFPASRDRVFRAWTDPRELEKWFAPSPDYTIVIPVLELRVGGRYVVEMHHKNGNVHRVGGAYRAVQPPDQISFTWQWLEREEAGESLVTVHFRELGKATEVRIVHELLRTALEREQHAQGWNGCFEQLANYL